MYYKIWVVSQNSKRFKKEKAQYSNISFSIMKKKLSIRLKITQWNLVAVDTSKIDIWSLLVKWFLAVYLIECEFNP